VRSAESSLAARHTWAGSRHDTSVIGSLRSIWPAWVATWVLTIGTAAITSAIVDVSLSKLWQRYDAGWFLHIAEHGYGDEPDAPAFYPLYALLLRAGGDLLGGHPVLAGFVLALPLTLIAFALLHALSRRFVDEGDARRTVAYLAVFPTAFFLCALYSEALFLVFAVAAFLAAERRRFLAAGLLAGAAMLTRPLGFAVLAGLVLLALREPARRAPLVRLAAAPAVFALYPLLLVAEGRHPFAFLGAEAHWRHTSSAAILRGPYEALRAAWNGAVDLAGGYDWVALLNVTAFIALVAFGCLSVLGWRRLGAPYGVYCLISLALPLFAPADPWPLVSIQRFVLALFPCFIVLATMPLGPRGHRLLLSLSAATLVFLVVQWTRGSFVA
jgi:hypothetical protein